MDTIDLVALRKHLADLRLQQSNAALCAWESLVAAAPDPEGFQFNHALMLRYGEEIQELFRQVYAHFRQHDAALSKGPELLATFMWPRSEKFPPHLPN